MFPQPRTKHIVKPTLERYIQDRLAEVGKTRKQLAAEMGVTTTLLTQRIKEPRKLYAEELTTMVTALHIDDWYSDLVVNFGAGLDGCTVAEFDKMLHPMGYELGRVNVAA